MNVYKISQTVNHDWDTYDSAVVIAESAEEAQNMHPGNEDGSSDGYGGTWAKPKDVLVEHIGTALPGATKRVVCSSFNAG